MNRIKLIRFAVVFSVALVSFSCSNESNLDLLENLESESTYLESQNPESSVVNGDEKKVSYELNGDFSGKLDITFLSSDGFTPPDQILGAKIPWETSYSVPADIYAIGGFANGLYSDANPGENASLKMYLDDYLIETVMRTADEDGSITLPLESYYLEFDDSTDTISQKNIGMEVSYRVDGNFNGKMNLIYRIEDGSRQNIIVNKDDFPWAYTFKTTLDSNKASIYGSGLIGAIGQRVKLSITVDGVETTTAIYESKENDEVSNPEIYVDFK